MRAKDGCAMNLSRCARFTRRSRAICAGAITREVAEAALELQARGALLMGLSDKPDEASFPPAGLAQRGYLPLHHVRMKVVGSDNG